MRKGWEYKKLGEVGTFLRGKNILKSDFVEKGLPCIHYGQIHTKFGISTDTHLTETSQEVYDKAIIASKKDVLIAITSEDLEGSCKATAWLGDYDVAVSAHAAVFKHNLNPKYIVYYLKSQSFYIEKSKYARGFKVMEIKPTDIAKIPIPIPPKSTQLAIVSELDKINELIRLKKEKLKDFDNLAQSLFYEMFGDPVENEKGWEVKKLGEIGEVKTGNTPSRSNDNFYNEKFIEWIKTDNIRNEQMNPTTAAEYLSKEGAECGRIAGKGSILVACIAGSLSSIGKCCITTKNVAFNQQINAITPYGDFCNSIYLYELIRNSSKYIQQNATTGMKHILSKSIFEKLKFPLPPLSLQRLFAQRIEQIEREKSEVQKSIQDFETLLASRMQYWFE